MSTIKIILKEAFDVVEELVPKAARAVAAKSGKLGTKTRQMRRQIDSTDRDLAGSQRTPDRAPDHDAPDRVAPNATGLNQPDAPAANPDPLPAANPDGDGPVTFRPPPNATPDEIRQVREYVEGCNEALTNGELSPTGRVSTQGALRRQASAAAAAERARAVGAGNPYVGHAGHVPDTTWTGNALPPGWMDLDARVNQSLGGQVTGYPVGHRPTQFIFEGLDD